MPDHDLTTKTTKITQNLYLKFLVFSVSLVGFVKMS
jgi:hypothetical protein